MVDAYHTWNQARRRVAEDLVFRSAPYCALVGTKPQQGSGGVPIAAPGRIAVPAQGCFPILAYPQSLLEQIAKPVLGNGVAGLGGQPPPLCRQRRILHHAGARKVDIPKIVLRQHVATVCRPPIPGGCFCGIDRLAQTFGSGGAQQEFGFGLALAGQLLDCGNHARRQSLGTGFVGWIGHAAGRVHARQPHHRKRITIGGSAFKQ